MRQLTYVKKGVLEWRDVRAPQILEPTDAIVRPFVASRCDGDAVFLFHDYSKALSLGAALSVIDPRVHALGERPFAGPFPYGHECVAEVVEVGEKVLCAAVGQIVIVPWAVSCGVCARCKRGLTSKCERNTHPVSGYGFGDSTGGWGGMVSDTLRVPYADHMLVPVPDGIDPVTLAAASDNIPDAWRCVAPFLREQPGAPVLVVGGNAKSIGLYAVGIAVALGASRVDYVDTSQARVALAASLGANAQRVTGKERWLRKGTPLFGGGYAVAVDASNHHWGLDYAVRALAPGGTATSVGFYLFRGTKLPLWQMYLNESTFRIGLSNPRADLPALLPLIASGRFLPGKVTSQVSDWGDAAEAFLEKGTKAVVTRPRVMSSPSPDARP
jgi:threonine dehydrogenase-like Zn-dependent dehydrogenase